MGHGGRHAARAVANATAAAVARHLSTPTPRAGRGAGAAQEADDDDATRAGLAAGYVLLLQTIALLILFYGWLAGC